MRLLHSSTLTPGKASALIQSALASISENDLRDWVRRISIPRHFRAQAKANEAVAQGLLEQLQSWGYDVAMQGTLHNIVACPKSSSATPTSETILVGAHYDSVPGSPGADDNGSAVVALLGCAQACARFAPDAPVCFVAFNCEEDGMLGSGEFVADPKRKDRRIRVAHILEMVGYASSARGSQRLPSGLPIQVPDVGDFLGLLANQNSGEYLEGALRCARTYLPALPAIGLEVPVGAEVFLPVLARSDHLPFWEEDIPAVMWTDTSEFRNPHYHQASDTPETLDYGFLRRVTQVLTACVLEGVN